MYDFIRENQLNIMLLLCGACGILTFLLIITRFLTMIRKWILIQMELVAFFLLWFDRLAYIYSGDVSSKGYVMVRLSNFMVFFLTPAIVLGFNMFIWNYLSEEGGMDKHPRRLLVTGYASGAAMLLAVISALTELYYYFDERNVYHRGPGFLIAYIIPIVCPLIQWSVVLQYKKKFSKLIFISMLLYIFVPIFCGILQIFTYGISIVNMAMVAVSVSLYIFMYLDLNNTVEHAHEIEIKTMQGQQRRMQRVFDQIAKAFVAAVEKKDDFTKGNAVKEAEYARKLAKLAGKDEEFCEKVYYAALLHDVGMIGIPDSVIKNDTDPGKYDYETIRQKPVIGKEILANITEYPYLSEVAAYSHERYNGTGYPEGLKGAEIPEIARIVAVADAYVTMTTPKRYRDAKPEFVAREAFIKGQGAEFDPVYAELMVKIIDDEGREKIRDDISLVEKELSFEKYRETVSLGIPVTGKITNITFKCDLSKNSPSGFSAPSIILFDSYDRRVHAEAKAIKVYHYIEYGEVWFDNHSITTAARKIEETMLETEKGLLGKGEYTIVCAKYEDHLKLTMTSPENKKEVIVALMDGSTSVYLGITGEYCKVSGIEIVQTEEEADVTYIPRISEEISYIDHMESDIPNIQINQTRSSSTEGIEVVGKLKLAFHSMSLPIANFVWHCPYVVIFSSDNGRVQGRNYREYALIKINGELENKYEFAENSFSMKRKDSFPGWEAWKEKNREGLDCEISFERKGNRIITSTENLGIIIDNVTIISEVPDKVYVALTGDRCALTDIRIK
ncbi:MAG: HD domain-containing protein [Butyrivibrio sp.]|nr:HD domain-containing protein [Butyrivibrio sp.]